VTEGTRLREFSGIELGMLLGILDGICDGKIVSALLGGLDGSVDIQQVSQLFLHRITSSSTPSDVKPT